MLFVPIFPSNKYIRAWLQIAGQRTSYPIHRACSIPLLHREASLKINHQTLSYARNLPASMDLLIVEIERNGFFGNISYRTRLKKALIERESSFLLTNLRRYRPIGFSHTIFKNRSFYRLHLLSKEERSSPGPMKSHRTFLSSCVSLLLENETQM